MERIQVSVAEAKLRFSELINRVAYGKEEVLVTRRGKPVAVISAAAKRGLASVKGWLEEDDPFFQEMTEVEAKRHRQKMRATKNS